MVFSHRMPWVKSQVNESFSPSLEQRHGGELQGDTEHQDEHGQTTSSKDFQRSVCWPQRFHTKGCWLSPVPKGAKFRHRRSVRRQTGTTVQPTEIQTGCGDHKSLKSSCVGRCDSQQDFQGAKTTPLKQRQMRGGTRAKRAGRAQDISANKIKQTAFAFVSLVCQQVQSKLKV